MRRAIIVLLLLAAVGAGVWWQSRTPRPGAEPGNVVRPPVVPTPVEQKREVTIYLARPTTSGDYDYLLVPVHRQVDASQPEAEAALKALAEGPTAQEKAEGLVATLPAGTRVLGVKVADGLATADLDKDVRSKLNAGSAWEETIVYSVVNTVAATPGVRRVQIVLSGQPVESLAGHVGIGEPLEPNADMVAGGKGQ